MRDEGDGNEHVCAERVAIHLRQVTWPRQCGGNDPTGHPLPYLIPGFADAKAHARLGTTCYGLAPVKFDPTHDVNAAKMHHGDDERAPVDGLTWGLRVRFDAVSGFCRTRA